MPTIRNFALHAFDFPRSKRDDKGAPIPGNVDRLVFPAGVGDGVGKVRPSLTEIDDAALTELKEHDTAGAWFGPNGLVVEGTPRYPAGSPEAKAAQAEADRAAKAAADALHSDVDPGEKFRPESSSPIGPWGANPRAAGGAVPHAEATIAVHGDVVEPPAGEHQKLDEHGQPAPAGAPLPAEPSGLNTKAE